MADNQPGMLNYTGKRAGERRNSLLRLLASPLCLDQHQNCAKNHRPRCYSSRRCCRHCLRCLAHHDLLCYSSSSDRHLFVRGEHLRGRGGDGNLLKAIMTAARHCGMAAGSCININNLLPLGGQRLGMGGRAGGGRAGGAYLRIYA